MGQIWGLSEETKSRPRSLGLATGGRTFGCCVSIIKGQDPWQAGYEICLISTRPPTEKEPMGGPGEEGVLWEGAGAGGRPLIPGAMGELERATSCGLASLRWPL